MANRGGNNGNRDRLYFGGLQENRVATREESGVLALGFKETELDEGRKLRFVMGRALGMGSGVWIISVFPNLLHIQGQVTFVPRVSTSCSALQGQNLTVSKTLPG